MLSFIKAWRADAVKQLLGRAHDKHPPIVPQPRPDAPPGRQSVFPALGRDGATNDDDQPVKVALDAGVDLRDVQIAARHADPRTTMRYDRARKNLDRHPNYILAAYMASGT